MARKAARKPAVRGGKMAQAHTPKANANRTKRLREMRALGWVPGRGWPGGVDPRNVQAIKESAREFAPVLKRLAKGNGGEQEPAYAKPLPSRTLGQGRGQMQPEARVAAALASNAEPRQVNADEAGILDRALRRSAKVIAPGTSLPTFLQATADALRNIAVAILAADGIPDEYERDLLRATVDTYDAARERDERKRAE